MFTRAISLRPALAALIIAALPLGGCMSAPSTQSGVRIGDETLKQFAAGKTTESWLLAVLGPPTGASTVEGVENTRVYRYATGESASGIGALFSGKATKNTAVVYFVITDGIVTRFWADRAIEHTLLGKSVEEAAGEKQGK